MTASSSLLVPAKAAAQASTGTVEAREAVADLPGVRLFYLDTGGTGPAVVLLHAHTGTSRNWAEYQLRTFAAAGFRVIAYDRRGYGRTVVKEEGPVSTTADDLDALMTHLKIDRFHLVGTAAGGMVATDYSLAFPKRLRSLVVANSLMGVQDEQLMAIGKRLRPPQFDTLPPDFRELGPAYRAANAAGTEKWLALERQSRAPGPPPARQPWKMKATLQSLASMDVPTLLITGDADIYMPPPALQIVAKHMPRARTLMLREVNHSGYWEQPELFNRAVLDFIKKH